MGELGRFATRLRALLIGALAVAQAADLKALLREIADTAFLKKLVSTVESDPHRGYGRAVLFREERAELALVVLRPGERIRAHDHGVYEGAAHEDGAHPVVGMVMVVEGSELNRFYRLLGDETLEEIDARSLSAGEFLELSPQIIHSVENVGTVPAAALHAYIYAQDDPETRKRRF